MSAFLVCTIIDKLIALPVEAVERVLRSVEITALPGTPPGILGAINVEGTIINVIDIPARLNLPSQLEIELDDRIVITRTRNGALAFVVTTVEGVFHFADEQLELLREREIAKGVIKTEQGLILVLDQNEIWPAAQHIGAHAC